jgi:hypothetical protein
MRMTVAMLAVFALVVTTPLVALSQSTTPPAQTPPTSPAPSQATSPGTTIEGVVASVDATCGGKASADCQAIVEVTASPAPSSQGASSSTTSMKITIPKNLKITTAGASASASTPVKLAKGDQVKITYEQKQDANVATSVTITKSGS